MAGGEERNQNNCLRFSLIMIGFAQGVARQQLELLGPILAHVIRPLVWVRGLWSIELEKVEKSNCFTSLTMKAWTHLFDIVACLMKLGYPQELEVKQSSEENNQQISLNEIIISEISSEEY